MRGAFFDAVLLKSHPVLGSLRLGPLKEGLSCSTMLPCWGRSGGLISGDHTAIAITALVGTLIGGFILLLSIPGLIGGIGLLYRKEWARILVIILGFLNLLNIPFGTILGIYTIWALMRPEMVQYFGDQTRSQPPPASAPV
jgi:hypothetical protein